MQDWLEKVASSSQLKLIITYPIQSANLMALKRRTQGPYSWFAQDRSRIHAFVLAQLHPRSQTQGELLPGSFCLLADI
jgi:hypothetical protein